MVSAGSGYEIRLDARQLRTPAKAALVVPTLTMAQAIAAEWRASPAKVDPEMMPMTRAANAAIDKVTPQKAEVAANLASYGGTDLLCYRAGEPEALRARQDAAWDPWLVWAAQELGAPLAAHTGVMHGPQDQNALDRLAGAASAFDAFELAALHDLVAISGSLILGLAVAAGRISAEGAYDVSRIDETWQAEQWGVDEEAEIVVAIKLQSYRNAAAFLRLARSA